MTPTVRIQEPESSPWTVRRASIDLPEELERSLEKSPKALAAFCSWSVLQQWDVAWFIEESPDVQVRQRRANRAMSVLEGRLALLGS